MILSNNLRCSTKVFIFGIHFLTVRFKFCQKLSISKMKEYITWMKRVGLHLLFWGVIFFWRVNADKYTGVPLEKFVYINLLRIPPVIISTYILIYYILPKFLIKEKDYFKFVILFSLNFWVASWINQEIIHSGWMKELVKELSYKSRMNLLSLHPYRHGFVLLSIMVMASMIQFFKLFREKEKRERELEQKHLTTQLAFLKSQVNPHFLFNALNNIYSMAVQKDQPEIAEGIENLSGIMHYLTYESNAKFVAIEKEIALLQNYVDINHLRVADTDDTTISFHVEGDTSNKMIAPVILLPIIENAFKHGIKPNQRCLVSINISIKNEILKVKTTNTFFEKSEFEVKEKGIGLENVTKRLQLVYPDNHHFQMFEKEGFYHVELELNLNV